MPAISWDDPFGETHLYNPINRESRQAFRTAAGVYLTRNAIDVDMINREQKRLLPYFKALKMAADEILEEADRIDRELSKVVIFSRTVYRLPDQPDVLDEFFLQSDAHIVTLLNHDETSHPIVESLFPRKAFTDLTQPEWDSILTLLKFKRMTGQLRDSGIPSSARVVFPETLGQIIQWIEDLDGPIKHLDYEVNIPSRRNMKHAVHDALIN